MTQVKQMLQQLVSDQVVPGVSAAILSGQQVWTEVIGDAQWLPMRKPLRPGMAYDLASLTKVLGTTTVFLQALTAGKVSVDQPIHDWLPEFTPATTFRAALTHTSGLESYIPHRDELAAPALRQALIDTLKPTGPKTVLYRDFNLLLVGWALENIYCDAIQHLIQTKVLEPLQLSGASFHPDPAMTVPTTYANGHLLQGVVHDLKPDFRGTCRLCRPVCDLARFDQLYPICVWSTHNASFSDASVCRFDARFCWRALTRLGLAA